MWASFESNRSGENIIRLYSGLFVFSKKFMFWKIEILWICVDFEWDSFTGPYEDINDEMEVVFTCILNGICFD